jgi:hypothetical protein
VSRAGLACALLVASVSLGAELPRVVVFDIAESDDATAKLA